MTVCASFLNVAVSSARDESFPPYLTHTCYSLNISLRRPHFLYLKHRNGAFGKYAFVKMVSLFLLILILLCSVTRCLYSPDSAYSSVAKLTTPLFIKPLRIFNCSCRWTLPLQLWNLFISSRFSVCFCSFNSTKRYPFLSCLTNFGFDLLIINLSMRRDDNLLRGTTLGDSITAYFTILFSSVPKSDSESD